MTIALVIAFSAGQNSGVETKMPAGLRTAPEKHCTAHKAVKFYAGRIAYWRDRMGQERVATEESSRTSTQGAKQSCPRYLAHLLQRKAAHARQHYLGWYTYHYAWWKWLPDKWARIGACETGYGKRPGQWTWNSGTYQGAFGFWYGTWDQYKPRGAPSEAYLATPRQQYQCALNVAAVHGYGAWGCGGA